MHGTCARLLPGPAVRWLSPVLASPAELLLIPHQLQTRSVGQGRPDPAAGQCGSASVPRTGKNPPEPASALSYSKRPINANDGAGMRCRRRRHCSSQTRAAPREGGFVLPGSMLARSGPWVGRAAVRSPDRRSTARGRAGSPVWAPLQSRSHSPEELPLCQGTHSAGIVRPPQSSPSEPAELLMKNGILGVGRCRFHTEQTLPSQLSA